jgi:hypothetical protein
MGGNEWRMPNDAETEKPRLITPRALQTKNIRRRFILPSA